MVKSTLKSTLTPNGVIVEQKKESDGFMVTSIRREWLSIFDGSLVCVGNQTELSKVLARLRWRISNVKPGKIMETRRIFISRKS